jgi:uncharacterized protein
MTRESSRMARGRRILLDPTIDRQRRRGGFVRGSGIIEREARMPEKRAAGRLPWSEAGAWALVTGASSGIGEAFARALARRGMRLVLVARRAERLATLARDLGGEACLPFALDLTRAGSVTGLQQFLSDQRVSVELLVSNAGVGWTGPFAAQPPESLGAILDLNLRIPAELARALVPAMVARGHGTVIHVVSMSAFQPVPYLAAYAASKAGLLSLTEGLARELAESGVRVQALCPGLVPTEFQSRAGTDRVAFNKGPAQAADFVVEASLRGLGSCRVVVIPGLRDRLVVQLQRMLPRALVQRIAGGLFRPAD